MVLAEELLSFAVAWYVPAAAFLFSLYVTDATPLLPVEPLRVAILPLGELTANDTVVPTLGELPESTVAFTITVWPGR